MIFASFVSSVILAVQRHKLWQVNVRDPYLDVFGPLGLKFCMKTVEDMQVSNIKKCNIDMY